MALGVGEQTRAGQGLESLVAYGTIVAPTILLPYVSESLNLDQNWQEQEILKGNSERAYPTLTGKKVGGSIRFKGGYRQLEWLVFAALGGDDSFVDTNDPAFLHTIDPANSILRASTLIIDKKVQYWNMLGMKVNKFTIDSSPDGVYFDYDLQGYALTEVDTYSTEMAALDWLEHQIMFHHQLVFRLGDCTNDLTDIDDAQAVSKISMELDNSLSPNAQTTTSGLNYPEPMMSGFRKTGLKFTIPRYEASTWRTAFLAGTKLQADLIWTGAEIGDSGFYYTFTVRLPTLYIKSCNVPVGGPDTVPVDVVCDCYANNGNTSTDMAAITAEIQIAMQNGSDAELEWTA
jgi:hypothetical protein